MNRSIPRIDLLMAGQTLPPISRRFGDFDRWFEQHLGSSASLRIHHLYNGTPLPKPAGSDGWIITGSSASVNDPLPWLPEAKQRIAAAIEADHPILGICFGHQLVAVSAGGQVAANPTGWELGVATIHITQSGMESPIFKDHGDQLNVYQTHQESVTKLPPQARVLATNEFGLQAFRVGRNVFGVQFHPEFTREIANMYVDLRSNEARGIPADAGLNGEKSSLVLRHFISYLEH